jgi:hypothetical protein
MRATATALAMAGLLAACAHPQHDEGGIPSMPRPIGGSPDQPPAEAMVPGSAYRAERNRCIDRELQRRGLNEYGDPPGTVYKDGSPTYDVVTGTTSDRHDYVYWHRRDIGVVCSEPVR